MLTCIEYAPAKINLTLAVSPLIIAGKHQLSSIFTTLTLSDRLEFSFDTKAAETKLEIETSYVKDLLAVRIPDNRHTVVQAIQAFENALGQSLPASQYIKITKRIPIQAGLGGGSSDAAATLRVLRQTFASSMSKEELSAIAAKVGADVPFLLTGGTAWMDGAGERLVRHLPTPALHVLLVKPPLGVSTRLAYQAFDSKPEPSSDSAALALALQTASKTRAPDTQDIAHLLDNNLTRAASEQVPEIAELISALEQHAGVTKAQLCGSGSCVFALCNDAAAAADGAAYFKAQGYWSWAGKTVEPSNLR